MSPELRVWVEVLFNVAYLLAIWTLVTLMLQRRRAVPAADWPVAGLFIAAFASKEGAFLRGSITMQDNLPVPEPELEPPSPNSPFFVHKRPPSPGGCFVFGTLLLSSFATNSDARTLHQHRIPRIHANGAGGGGLILGRASGQWRTLSLIDAWRRSRAGVVGGAPNPPWLGPAFGAEGNRPGCAGAPEPGPAPAGPCGPWAGCGGSKAARRTPPQPVVSANRATTGQLSSRRSWPASAAAPLPSAAN